MRWRQNTSSYTSAHNISHSSCQWICRVYKKKVERGKLCSRLELPLTTTRSCHQEVLCSNPFIFVTLMVPAMLLCFWIIMSDTLHAILSWTVGRSLLFIHTMKRFIPNELWVVKDGEQNPEKPLFCSKIYLNFYLRQSEEYKSSAYPFKLLSFSIKFPVFPRWAAVEAR